VAQFFDASAAGETATPQETLTKTILVVEDNELNMKLFNDLLCAHGYKVLKAMDGSAGLELSRQHRPDLIVMDVQLPEASRAAPCLHDAGRALQADRLMAQFAKSFKVPPRPAAEI